MRRWLAFVLVLLLSPPVMAQAPASPADQAAIRQVIGAQMAAFRRDDASAAFAFAAPEIQEKFRNAALFLEMVRVGYPAVYRPRSVEFADLVPNGDSLIQRVLLVGADGRTEVAHYVMERQADGTWRISGCYLTKSDDRST